jgi:glycine/D-amino acid oxidase-like deaminating enzyme
VMTSKRVSSGRVSVLKRLYVGTRLLFGLRTRDWRSGIRLMNHRFAGRPAMVRLAKLGVWSLRVAYVQIPDAIGQFSVSRAITRTPYWLRDGNPFASYPWRDNPSARLPETAEVVVVGAGFGGSSVAYHWAQRGSGRLVLLDRLAPAEGAAGRNAGFLTAAGGSYHGYYIYEPVRAYLSSARPELTSEQLDAVCMGYSDAYLRALSASLVAIHETIVHEGIECELDQRGCVILSDSDDAQRVQKALDVGAELGWPDWYRLEPAEVEKLTAIQGDDFAGFQVATSTWNPAAWVWGLVRAALATGNVELYTGVEVTRVEPNGDRFLVHTTHGVIDAARIVNATESSTAEVFASYLPHGDAGLVRTHKSQAMFADGGSPSMPRGRAVCLPLGWFHARSQGFLYGSDNHPVPLRQAAWNDPSRFLTMYMSAETVAKWPEGRFTVSREWTGTVGQAPDKAPIVGAMSYPGIFMLGGFAGAGSAISFGAALHIVLQMLGEGTDDSPWPADLFALERFYQPERYGERFLDEPST